MFRPRLGDKVILLLGAFVLFSFTALTDSGGKSLEQAPPRARVSGNDAISALTTRTLVLQSVADTMVLEGRPTTNFGSHGYMWAGYDEYLEPDGERARSFVLFNLSQASFPSPIHRATLQLYLISAWDYPEAVRTITTYRAPSAWEELSIVWGNAPQPADSYGYARIQREAWGWHSFDATGLVRAWQNGTLPNHGIVVLGPEIPGEDASWRGFSTREGPFPPQLVVECEDCALLRRVYLPAVARR